jgi:general secretion pathway protein E
MNEVAVKDHRLTLPEVVDALVAEGLVAAAAAEKFKQERRYFKGDAHPLVVVAEQKWKSLQPPHRMLDLEGLTQWMAQWAGLEYLHVDPLKINFSAVTEVMSNTYATRFRILPVEVKPNEVVIATAEPFQRGWEAEMKPILRKEIRRVVANPDDITRYQVEFYNLAKSVKGALNKGEISTGASNFEQLVELGKTNKQFDANDQHIVRIVDWLWQYAFEQRASDIHVEPRRELGIVRFRIDGVLHQVYQIPMTVLTAMTSRIKVLGRMDIMEKRRPQDGRIKTRMPDGQEVELRLATVPTAFGEKLVMRIFDPEVLVRDFSELGFAPEEAALWQQMSSQPNGIILVTGPTGSGKTVTLYSTLKNLATPEVNVCTLEDPIEMVEPCLQPGTDPGRHRRRFCRGHPRPDAPGPGHHHGRRDPRPGNRRHGDPGGADRPPRGVHPAHQRRALCHHPPDRPRRAALPALGDGARRHGPAPGAHAVPALQAARRPARRGRRRLDGAGRALEIDQADPALPPRRLPGLPHDGLQGPGRHL